MNGLKPNPRLPFVTWDTVPVMHVVVVAVAVSRQINTWWTGYGNAGNFLLRVAIGGQ